MELTDLKNKSVAELQELLAKFNAELHAHRLKVAAKALKQVHLISQLRRTIAQIQTLLTAKAKALVSSVK